MGCGRSAPSFAVALRLVWSAKGRCVGSRGSAEPAWLTNLPPLGKSRQRSGGLRLRGLSPQSHARLRGLSPQSRLPARGTNPTESVVFVPLAARAGSLLPSPNATSVERPTFGSDPSVGVVCAARGSAWLTHVAPVATSVSQALRLTPSSPNATDAEPQHERRRCAPPTEGTSLGATPSRRRDYIAGFPRAPKPRFARASGGP
jgi:hypothetical protein